MRCRLFLGALVATGSFLACGSPGGQPAAVGDDAGRVREEAPDAAPDAHDTVDDGGAKADAGDTADAADAGAAADASDACLRVTTLVLDSPSSIASIAGVTCIAGDVRVRPGAFDANELSLPDLVRVEGSLRAEVSEGHVLRTPKLTSVRGTLEVDASGDLIGSLEDVGALVLDGPRSVGLGALRHAGSVTLRGNTGTASLPALQTVDHDFTIELAADVQPVVKALETIGGTLRVASNANLASLDLPALRTVGAVDVASNAHLTSIDLSALRTTASSFAITDDPSLTSALLGSLETVGSFVRVRGNGALASMPLAGLRAAGSIEIDDAVVPELAFPLLVTCNGALTLKSEAKLARLALPKLASLAGPFTIDGAAALTSLDAHALTSAQALSVTGTALTDLSGLAGLVQVGPVSLADNAQLRVAGMPALAKAGSLSLVGSHAPALFDLPALAEVTGTLLVGDNPGATALGKLPKLAHVGWLVLAGDSLTSCDGLDALRTVDTWLEIDGTHIAQATALRGVTRVGEVIAIEAPELTAFALPALEHVTTMIVESSPKLASIELRAAVDAASLVVSDDAALTSLVTPALRNAKDVQLTGLPSLSSCVVTALRAQLQGTDASNVHASGVKLDPGCPLTP